MFRDDQFVLLHQRVDPCDAVPVEGRGMAIRDDVIGFAVDIEASPFAVEEVEIEALLLDE